MYQIKTQLKRFSVEWSHRICGSKVQHDRNAISNHLRAHNLKLSDYAVRYKPYKKSGPLEAPPAPPTHDNSTKHWFDGCEYRCALECSHTTNSRSAIAHHLKNTHKEKAREGVNFNVVQESSIECRLCFVDIYQNEGQIRAHLTTRHSMSMEDFAERFVENGVLVDCDSAPPPLGMIHI